MNKNLEKINDDLFAKFQEFEISTEQASLVRGGNDLREYCSSLYMIRSCNTLSSGAMTGFHLGWGSNGCSRYSGADLWNNAPSQMSQVDCDTSWYSY